MAAKYCCELADILAQKFDKHFEAIPYYEKAIGLFSTTQNTSTGLIEANVTLQAILVHFKLASLKAFTCDYSGALNSYTDIQQSILNKCVRQPQLTKTTSSSNSIKQDQSYAKVIVSNSNQIYDKPIGLYSKLLIESDIAKLLLLLYLKPTKMKPEHSSTIEAYSNFFF